MVTIINTHEVADFNEWKKMFDGGATARANAGINIKDVFVNLENPKQVTVISEAASEEVAKGFLANLKVSFEKSGNIVKPEIKILERAF